MLLVAGVGYPDLGDLSFGPVLIERSRQLIWPSSVEFEDLSYNPIAVVEWLREQRGRLDRAIVVGAAERGRQPGSLARAAWTDGPRSIEEVQACVAEAVTGTISLENLLVIARHFDVLPAGLHAVELEPYGAEPMTGLTDVGEQRLAELIEWIRGESQAPNALGNGSGAWIAAR